MLNRTKIAALGILVSSLVGCGQVGSVAQPASFTGASVQPPTPTPVATPLPMQTSALPKPRLPQVLFGGGDVLTAPRFVVVTFPGDKNAAAYETNTSKYLSSREFMAQTIEYGVGLPRVMAPLRLTTALPASMSDDDLANFVYQNIVSVKKLGEQDIPVLFIPSSTTLTQGGGTGCQEFDGYHGQFSLNSNGERHPYAVVMECSGYTVNDNMSTTSHEIVEVSSNPYWRYQLAYTNVDDPFTMWPVLNFGGSELGDMCESFADSFYNFSDLGFTIQRTWSNAAAAALKDPCVPAIPGRIYFNSAPVANDDVVYEPYYNQLIKGIRIPVGQTKTVDVQLFSEAPTSGDWTVSAYETGGDPQIGSPSWIHSAGTNLSISFDKNHGSNGDVIHMTVTVLSENPNGLNGEIVIVKSTLNGVNNYWPVFVGN